MTIKRTLIILLLTSPLAYQPTAHARHLGKKIFAVGCIGIALTTAKRGLENEQAPDNRKTPFAKESPYADAFFSTMADIFKKIHDISSIAAINLETARLQEEPFFFAKKRLEKDVAAATAAIKNKFEQATPQEPQDNPTPENPTSDDKPKTA